MEYKLAKKCLISLEKAPSTGHQQNAFHRSNALEAGHYVYDIETNVDGSCTYCSVSNHTIVVYDSVNFTTCGIKSGHRDKINVIEASVVNPFILYSGSSDKSVSIWDSRVGASNAMNIRCIDEVLGLSVSMNDSLLALGIGTSVQFYDIRYLGTTGSTKLGEYNDTHTDIITQLKFNRTNPSILGTAAEDGLICIYDTKVSENEEAIQTILNTECPIRRFGYFGNNMEGVYCLSSVETFSCWHFPTAIRIGNFPQIREQLAVDYLVDCLYDTAADSLQLLAGNYDGAAKLISVDPDALSVVQSTFSNGHCATIRCLSANRYSNTIVTGGEDSMVCQWRYGNTTAVSDEMVINDSDKLKRNVDDKKTKSQGHHGKVKSHGKSNSDRMQKPY